MKGNCFRIIILLLLVVLFPAFSVEEDEALVFTVAVPEDYGVSVPEDAVMIDKMAVSVGRTNGTDELLTETSFHLGSVSEAQNTSMDFTMLYYGNLAEPYDVYLEVDPGIGWYMYRDGELYSFPIDVSFLEPDATGTGIESEIQEDIEGRVPIYIEATGPQSGLPVVKVHMAWEGYRNLIPGMYQADIDLRVGVL